MATGHSTVMYGYRASRRGLLFDIRLEVIACAVIALVATVLLFRPWRRRTFFLMAKSRR